VAGYLIDSHIFLWAVESPKRLSAVEQSFLTDPRNDVAVSVASLWELSIKISIGRLAISRQVKSIPPDHFSRSASQVGIRILPIDVPEAEYVRQLPWIHRDPFDRLIIAQALIGGRVIVTRDSIFARYPAVQIFVP
jgi:PIN domain nuclease of toxin-antitoxin system